MTQFTDTDVRMLYAVAADMTRQGQVHAADDLRNLAERIRTQLPTDAQLAREPAPDLRTALQDIIEAIQYTPLGLRALLALNRARQALGEPVGDPPNPMTAEWIARQNLSCLGLKPPCKFDCPCWAEAQKKD